MDNGKRDEEEVRPSQRETPVTAVQPYQKLLFPSVFAGLFILFQPARDWVCLVGPRISRDQTPSFTSSQIKTWTRRVWVLKRGRRSQHDCGDIISGGATVAVMILTLPLLWKNEWNNEMVFLLFLFLDKNPFQAQWDG